MPATAKTATQPPLSLIWDAHVKKGHLRQWTSSIWAPQLASAVTQLVPRGETICDFAPASWKLVYELLRHGYKTGFKAASEPEKAVKWRLILAGPGFLDANTVTSFDNALYIADITPREEEKTVRALAEIDGQLKKGGLLLFTAYLNENPATDGQIFPDSSQSFYSAGSLDAYTQERLYKFLLNRKFKIKNAYRLSYLNCHLFKAIHI